MLLISENLLVYLLTKHVFKKSYDRNSQRDDVLQYQCFIRIYKM